jgi:hypothetical protein
MHSAMRDVEAQQPKTVGLYVRDEFDWFDQFDQFDKACDAALQDAKNGVRDIATV